MDAKFYNKMPFNIPLRKTWEAGAPKLLLQPGEVIVGPADILSQFQFLAQIPFDYSRVESMTQNSNFAFKDELLDENVNKKRKPFQRDEEETVVEKVEEVEMTEKQQELAKKVTKAIEKQETSVEDSMDFDPKTVNWVSVKVEQLERACRFLKINTDFLNDKKPKEKKWELVKLVKAYYKI
jgi:hypothetical protein